MNINDLFEAHWADMHDCTPAQVKSYRMSNNSYAKADLATGFRNFSAGFEAKGGGEMRLLGFLSPNGVTSAKAGKAAFFYPERTRKATVAVYVKESEGRKVEKPATEATCRGDIRLGTDCGKCTKCLALLQAYRDSGRDFNY